MVTTGNIMTVLEPLTPQKAVEMYIADRKPDRANATPDIHRRYLKYFVDWREAEEIDNLNSASGRALHRFRQVRECLQGVEKRNYPT